MPNQREAGQGEFDDRKGEIMKRKRAKMQKGVKTCYRWFRRKAYQVWAAQVRVTELAIGGELDACGADVIFRGNV